MSERTPWFAMLQVAKALGIAPESFWRLGLREWRALVSTTSDALSRAAFAELAHRFPD